MTTLGMNAAFSAGTSLLGIRNDPYQACNFFVEIEGLIIGGFTEVTGLQLEVEVESYREGGVNGYIHQLPGPARYPANLVLKHGVTDIETLWSWQDDVAKGTIKRKSGTIYLLDQRRLPATWWDFYDAYPVRWIGPELRADSSTVAVETLELVHRGISKPKLSTAVAAARGILAAAGDVGIIK